MNTEDSVEHEGKTFEKISYQDKTLVDRKFMNCVFKKCNLSNTIFKDCFFDDCLFEDCDLSLMKVKSSTFKRCRLNGSKAIGIQWFDTRNPFSISFVDCNISYCSFFAKDLKKTRFVRCKASETDFSECNLTEAVFEGSDLSDSRFINCDLSWANFKGAVHYGIDLRVNKVKRTKFDLPEAMSLLNSFDIELD